MNAGYLKYYDRPSAFAPFRFLFDGLLCGSNLRRVSLLNRKRDYERISGDAGLLALHKNINQLLLDAGANWQGYDYGEGYLYQGCPQVGLSGLRDTGARVEAMELASHVAGRSVLEIGCNSGFLSLSIADAAKSVVGFDVNPYLIKMGEVVGQHLGIDNVSLLESSFESFDSDEKFGAVLSFANHTTYDGNTKQTLSEYFGRCARHLDADGILLFESHAPGYEKDRLDGVLDVMAEHFDIQSKTVLNYGTFLDDGRTFCVARKR